MRSSVDFPQPDGPTMQMNSPAAILRSILSSASTCPAALTYSLRRFAISIAAPRRWTAMISPRRLSLHRHPGSLLSLFSSTNGGSFVTASRP
jgi:hypothetical protein